MLSWCPGTLLVLPGRSKPGKNLRAADTNIAVTLSTMSSSTAEQQQVNDLWADFCAVACAASAGVHAALVVPHLHESVALAAAFAVAAAALGVAALGQAILASASADAAVAVLLLGVAVAYGLSRTTGLPVLAVPPEPFDALGVATSCVELAAAGVALRLLVRRSSS